MLNVKDEASVDVLALKLIDQLAEPCNIDGVMVSVACSIGVALYPRDGESAPELLKHADMSMYAAKGEKTPAAFGT